MIGANLSNPVSTLEEGKGFGLGDRYCATNGDEYIFVQADGAISANDVVIISEAYQADQIDTTNSDGALGDRVGVAPAAFSDDDYGWVQVKGTCSINVATGAAANTKLNTTATAGRVDDDATAGAETIHGLYTTGAESSNVAAGILLGDPHIDATL
ncbi:hypothetical protein [Celeribacter naphthalenivorans]|uniref:hypothetical protein n=1 Tax=Celeribacter naphthalenivorans TaxID=1614694 RepID=UPI001CFAC257|nr:hypothetical protein [Celeribacter naphthalenivorans]